jgi:hypothetical protein
MIIIVITVVLTQGAVPRVQHGGGHQPRSKPTAEEPRHLASCCRHAATTIAAAAARLRGHGDFVPRRCGSRAVTAGVQRSRKVRHPANNPMCRSQPTPSLSCQVFPPQPPPWHQQQRSQQPLPPLPQQRPRHASVGSTTSSATIWLRQGQHWQQARRRRWPDAADGTPAGAHHQAPPGEQATADSCKKLGPGSTST